jgi:predicted protein tyrosine phosphatase
VISGEIPNVTVSCLPKAAAVVRWFRATHVFSFLDPTLSPNEHPDFSELCVLHRKYVFFDQEEGAHTAALEAAISEYIKDVRVALLQGGSRIVIHCHAGVSRSTAACYIANAMCLGPGRECQAFQGLMCVTRKPWPNRKIVAVADQILGADSRLLAPCPTGRLHCGQSKAPWSISPIEPAAWAHIPHRKKRTRKVTLLRRFAVL